MRRLLKITCFLAILAGCSSEGRKVEEARHGEAERKVWAQAPLYATAPAQRSAAYPRKKWPVQLHSIGHTNASYQNYGGDPYFHHGLDIRADAGSDVLAAAGGKVVNIENYMPGSAYWEIAIQDDLGFLWQYHHVDHGSIPQAVQDAFRNGGRVEEGQKLGEIFYWDVVTFGERYHHIHLNVLAEGGKFQSPFDFLEPLPDTQAPQFVEVGLLKNGRKVSGATVSGQYTVFATVHDLIMHEKFVVPPHFLSVSVDGAAPRTVWEFTSLPGGTSETQYVESYFVPSMVCGDYECRKLVIDLGFARDGTKYFPTAPGPHAVEITARDYAGNETKQAYSWQVN